MRHATRLVLPGLLWAAASCAAPPSTERPAPAAGQETDETMSGAHSPAGDAHPGTIENIDEIGDRTWTRSAAEVPPTIAWAEVDGRYVPVVRIVSTGTADRRRITRYGPDGQMLDTTIQAPRPPARPAPTPTPQPTPKPTPGD